jgi:diadenosine tetraphosphate (Ap4A) HIT family hydrolase
VFNTVAEAGVNIRMISQGASEINISFVVKESDVPQAVRHLHAHFFPASADKTRSPGKQPKRVNGSAARLPSRSTTSPTAVSADQKEKAFTAETGD